MELNIAEEDPHLGQANPRLTFGVEIEFSVATVRKEMTGKDGEDPESNDPRSIFGLTEGIHDKETENVREHIAQTLRYKAGVVAGTSIRVCRYHRVILHAVKG